MKPAFWVDAAHLFKVREIEVTKNYTSFTLLSLFEAEIHFEVAISLSSCGYKKREKLYYLFCETSIQSSRILFPNKKLNWHFMLLLLNLRAMGLLEMCISQK